MTVPVMVVLCVDFLWVWEYLALQLLASPGVKATQSRFTATLLTGACDVSVRSSYEIANGTFSFMHKINSKLTGIPTQHLCAPRVTGTY